MDKEEDVMLFGIPLWIYIMIAFIFFRGYMAHRAIQADKKREQQYIENEGKIYMKRIEEERKKKERKTQQTSRQN